MDKISSIISTRSTVDMSKERPVRAGAPSYGRPVSQATQTFQKTKQERSEETTSPAFQVENQKVNSPTALRHSGIIDKITLSFKGNPESEFKPQVVDLTPEQDLSLSSLENENTSSSEENSVSIYV